MSEWSLEQLLATMHDDIQRRLNDVRKNFGHPGIKGDASEKVWLELMKTYLPQRYSADTAHVVDSEGNFSDQIDIVVFDRQYSPFVFRYAEQTIIPSECVYAVFEVKQTINASHVQYAKEKVASVRRLRRTSLPIPHAGGTYDPKPPFHIIGGLLTFESDWNPPLGSSLTENILDDDNERQLDIGCVAAHGYYRLDRCTNDHEIFRSARSATAFLFELISTLQTCGTVPMIDVRAYARWIPSNFR